MSGAHVRINHFLDSLSKADHAHLVSGLKPIALEQGTLLYEPDEKIKEVYFPVTGAISRFKVLQDGSAIETALVGCEGALGIVAGLGLHTTRSRAMVQLRLTGMQIAADYFLTVVQGSAALRYLIANYCAASLYQAQTTAACNAVHSVEARFCRWLLQASDRSESRSLPLTQETLSQILGVRRASVNKVENTLQAAGIIAIERGAVKILDRPRLKARSCECYATLLIETRKILENRKNF